MVFLQFGFYYYLRLHNVSTEFLLKLLKRLLIGYAVITVLCYLQYPNCWFGGDDEQSLARMKSSLEDRGLIRFTLPCKMLVPLFLFMEIQNLGLWVNNKMNLDAESVSGDLLKVCKTKKTELLFLALFLRIMKIGGRCACIVPDGVLFGSSRAHKSIRKEIVENQRLEAVISMPSGVFKPYAGVSTAILIFTKTEHGGTDQVWFYDMEADGFSLDDKRTPVTENDIPDIVERFKNLDKEVERKRTDQSFMVPKKDIVENDYDLSINKYKEIEYTPVEYPPTSEIMANIRELELEIGKEMDELERLLGL